MHGFVLGFLLGGLLGFLLGSLAAKSKRQDQPEPRVGGMGGQSRGGEPFSPKGPKDDGQSQGHNSPVQVYKPEGFAGRQPGKNGGNVREPVNPQSPVSQPPVRSPSAVNRNREQTRMLYRSFQPVGTLELNFQYSFPLSHLFREGRGYLYNSQLEVLPETSVFSQTDSAKGYAMNGLFWVYDAIYEGRVYTFDQIMEDQLGDEYIRIVAVRECARIEGIAKPGHYVLKKRGKLEVAKYEGTGQF